MLASPPIRSAFRAEARACTTLAPATSTPSSVSRASASSRLGDHRQLADVGQVPRLTARPDQPGRTGPGQLQRACPDRTAALSSSVSIGPANAAAASLRVAPSKNRSANSPSRPARTRSSTVGRPGAGVPATGRSPGRCRPPAAARRRRPTRRRTPATAARAGSRARPPAPGAGRPAPATSASSVRAGWSSAPAAVGGVAVMAADADADRRVGVPAGRLVLRRVLPQRVDLVAPGVEQLGEAAEEVVRGQPGLDSARTRRSGACRTTRRRPAPAASAQGRGGRLGAGERHRRPVGLQFLAARGGVVHASGRASRSP